MQKAYLRKIALLLCSYLLCITCCCLAQLHIASGTKWVGTTETVVVLNDMGLQYDAGPMLLNNIFRFSGTRSATISGNTAPKIYAISLAKTNPGQISLNQSIAVTRRINFESGLLDLNGNAITLDPKALLTNENESSRIIGTAAGGYISIDADISVAGGPVNPGNLGAYITTAVDLGITNIARGHDRQHINDTSLGIARWYELSVPDIREPSTNLRFYYLTAETAGAKPDSLELWKGYDFSGWTDLGYTSRNTIAKYVEKQQLTSLHRFTLYASSDTSSVAPPPPPPTYVPGVVFLFAASWAGDKAFLNWTVTKEANNDHFSVERKYPDETDFTAIANVPSKVPGVISDSVTQYSYTDAAVSTVRGIISYRIHQVGKGGESTYSNTVILTPPVGTPVFIRKIFPTIAIGGQIYIQAGSMSLTNMQIQVFDWTAKLLLSKSVPYQSQWLPLAFSGHGIYRIVIRSGTQRFNGTFIK